MRDHDIEPHEAEECFRHKFFYARDERRFDDVYVLDGRTDRGRRLRLVFQDEAMVWCECLRVGIIKIDEKAICKTLQAPAGRVEADYHKMSPHEFDAIMTGTSVHRPNVKSKSKSGKGSIQKSSRLKPQVSR